MSGLNSRIATMQFGQNHYNYDSINLNYFLSTIEPSTYQARKPNEGVKTSLMNGSTTINLVSNTSGNGAVYILPSNIFNSLKGSFLVANPIATY